MKPKFEPCETLRPGTAILASPGAIGITDIKLSDDGKSIEVVYHINWNKIVVVTNIGQ